METFLRKGEKPASVARDLRIHRSIISRELSRNGTTAIPTELTLSSNQIRLSLTLTLSLQHYGICCSIVLRMGQTHLYRV